MRRLPAAGASVLIAALALGSFPATTPASAAAPSCTGWESAVVPPPTINVLRTARGRVETVPFRRYVEAVLASEWGPTHPPEALAAGAVAVKQYAWYHAMAGHWRGGLYDGTCYDVRDSSADQVYAPETKSPSTAHLAAVRESWPVSLRKPRRSDPDDRFFPPHYDAGAALRACGSGVTGRQLWQLGASNCALRGYGFQEILRLYYGPHLEVVTTARHDFDGGGRGDIGVLHLAEQSGTANALVYRSTGQAIEFGSIQPLGLAPSDVRDWVTADLDGDGLADLAVLVGGTAGPQIQVLRGEPSGLGPAETWWTGTADEGLLPLSAAALDLVSADWDGDGRSDLGLLARWDLGLLARLHLRLLDRFDLGPLTRLNPGGLAQISTAEGTARLYQLQARGDALDGPTLAWEGPASGRTVAAYGGDFDGDGRGDLVRVEDRGADGLAIVVVPSDPAGLVKAEDWYVEPVLAAADIAPLVADIDGDGKDDVVFFARDEGGGATVNLYRAAEHSFARETLLSVSEEFAWASSKVGASDLDGDGRDDLFVVSADAPSGASEFFALISQGRSLVPERWGGDPSLGWAEATPY